jgi:hypothetical protein
MSMIWEMLADDMEKAGEANLRVASPLSPMPFSRLLFSVAASPEIRRPSL